MGDTFAAVYTAQEEPVQSFNALLSEKLDEQRELFEEVQKRVKKEREMVCITYLCNYKSYNENNKIIFNFIISNIVLIAVIIIIIIIIMIIIIDGIYFCL